MFIPQVLAHNLKWHMRKNKVQELNKSWRKQCVREEIGRGTKVSESRRSVVISCKISVNTPENYSSCAFARHKNRSHKYHWQIVLVASEHPTVESTSWNSPLRCWAVYAASVVITYPSFGSCFKAADLYSLNISQFCRCAMLSGSYQQQKIRCVPPPMVPCGYVYSTTFLSW